MLYENFKRHRIKNHSDMFWIVCDPSSGSRELYLTEIRSSQTVVPYTLTTGSKLRCQTLTKHMTNISEPLKISVKYSSIPRVELLVSHWVPPQAADRGTFPRYGGHQGNKIPGADQNQYHCPVVSRGICKG
jgi:hypothetical protein